MDLKFTKELLEDFFPELLESREVKYLLFSHYGPEAIYCIKLSDEQIERMAEITDRDKKYFQNCCLTMRTDAEMDQIGAYNIRVVHMDHIHENKGTMLVQLNETYKNRMEYFHQRIEDFENKHKTVLNDVNNLNLDM